MRTQRIAALLLLAACVVYGGLALRIEGTGGLSASRMGPAAFPIALAILGVMVALSLVVRPGPESAALAGDGRRTAGLVLLTLLYAVGLATLGFFLSTVIFLGLAQFVLGERRPRLLAGLPLAMALTSSLTLRLLLGVWLPEPVLRWLGSGP